MAGPFSQWPETAGPRPPSGPPSGLREFADIARREYVAVGIRVALHPQMDLATEPRWPRINTTFGEDAELASRLAVAYVRGLQGDRLGAESVAAMTKHFPGGGPQKDGNDPHFAWGREQVYPGGNFDYHLRPFRAALAAGAAADDALLRHAGRTEWEEVGFSFNKSVITGLLRDELGFDGIVCTDWDLITDRPELGDLGVARGLGRRAPERRGPGGEGARGRRGPVRRRGLHRCAAVGDPRRPGQRVADRRVGAPAAADEVRPRFVRPAVPRRGRGRGHGGVARISARRAYARSGTR